jgi:ubiquinone/menaquinone biosynthesis C-methylase UbiE
MTSGGQNPFHDFALAAPYQSWYATRGRRAVRRETQLLRWLLDRFPAARTILEVGCGTGHFTRWLEAQGLEAVGLDSSAAMLAEAAQLGTRILVRGDALALPFADASVDLVAFITTLEFIFDPASALAEGRRIARQGMILGVINRRSRLGARYRRQGGPVWSAARFFTPRELLEEVGPAAGLTASICWRTTLWPFWRGATPLPWGGFIGMAVRW